MFSILSNLEACSILGNSVARSTFGGSKMIKFNLGPIVIEVPGRHVWRDAVAVLLIKVWCLAKESNSAGISLSEVVESISKLKG